jgi:hypothetical protein
MADCHCCLLVLAEVRSLRAELAAMRTARVLCRADRQALARILPAIGGAMGSDLFVAREVVRHDSSAVQVALDGMNAKSLGRLFLRADGIAIDGYVVQREGAELNCALWRVVQS